MDPEIALCSFDPTITDPATLRSLAGLSADDSIMRLKMGSNGIIDANFNYNYPNIRWSRPSDYGIPSYIQLGQIIPIPYEENIFIVMTRKGKGRSNCEYKIFQLAEGTDLEKIKEEIEKGAVEELNKIFRTKLFGNFEELRKIPGLRNDSYSDVAPEATMEETMEGARTILYRWGDSDVPRWSTTRGNARGYELYTRRHTDGKSFAVLLYSYNRVETLGQAGSPEAWIRQKLGDKFMISDAKGRQGETVYWGSAIGLEVTPDEVTFIATPR